MKGAKRQSCVPFCPATLVALGSLLLFACDSADLLKDPTLQTGQLSPSVRFSSSAYTFIEGQPGTTGVPANLGAAVIACVLAPGSPPLPAGLSIDGENCQIEGIPTSVYPAATLILLARSSAGNQQISVPLEVVQMAPSISYTGSPYTFAVEASGTTGVPQNLGSGIVSCALASGSPALPPGLSLDGSSCEISGTPTAPSAQTGYDIVATNAAGSGQATFLLQVNDVPPSLSFPSDVVVVSVDQPIDIIPTVPTGAGVPTSCVVLNGSLPQGTSLDPLRYCAITGIPLGSGSGTATILASNSSGGFLTSVSIEVSEMGPKLYYQGGGTPVFTFLTSTAVTTGPPLNKGSSVNNCALISGALPAGLTVDPNTCAIGGTTSSAISNAAITVGEDGEVLASVTIGVAPAPSGIVAPNSVAFGNGTLTLQSGTPAHVGPTASTTIIWCYLAFATGPLPPGLTIDNSCTISGTPTEPGTWSMSVDAGSAGGAAPPAPLTIVVH
jgi:hypothetical protein